MLEITQTADGSNTIYNPEVGENYHSMHGALQESMHVFLNMGLKYFLAQHTEYATTALLNYKLHTPISILEVGFGTGLNFLLSADFCRESGLFLAYTGIEAYPLTAKMTGNTGYQQYVREELWEQFLANYSEALKLPASISANCKLQIFNSKLENFQTQQSFDIIYYDAFAASRQPEMWDGAAISHTIEFLKPGGVFVTYAITGNLKRTLKALNFKVEKLQGAPGKREMLRAVKMF